MRINGPVLVSLAILAGIGGWMFTGKLIQGGIDNPNAETIAEREAKRTKAAFRVRVIDVQPTERVALLNIRGRTKADAQVSVRAETGGTVERRPVKKGDVIKAGDVLCEIDRGVRSTNLDQAVAQLEQAEQDYLANKQLADRGFTTNSRLRQLKAAMDAATAAVATAKQELARTEIKATANGTVQKPMAEIGDNLAPGGVCVTLMQLDPMLFSGQVSERDISQLKIGMATKVDLVGGERVAGTLKYISPVADPKTRTFSIEVAMPNPDFAIKDGLTASATIPLKPTLAYQVASSWLTLADDGEVGIRAVDEKNIVQFHPVKILAQDEKTMWVSGLKPGLKVITLGQNFVSAGELVDPVTEEQLKQLQQKLSRTQPAKNAEVKS